MKRFIITEEEKNHIKGLYEQILGHEVGPVKSPSPTKSTIVGTPQQFLQNNSKELNIKLGIPVKSITKNKCFGYSISSDAPSTFGVGDNEIEKYMDYLGVYGNIPGTGIPIPYQGDDLKQMIYFLQGGQVASNAGVYGPVERRTSNINGIIYPAVEVIRAFYSQMANESLYNALQKKMTDSENDLVQKQDIMSILLGAYKTWIDCANGTIDKI